MFLRISFSMDKWMNGKMKEREPKYMPWFIVAARQSLNDFLFFIVLSSPNP